MFREIVRRSNILKQIENKNKKKKESIHDTQSFLNDPENDRVRLL